MNIAEELFESADEEIKLGNVTGYSPHYMYTIIYHYKCATVFSVTGLRAETTAYFSQIKH